jgi:hypothetical protein
MVLIAGILKNANTESNKKNPKALSPGVRCFSSIGLWTNPGRLALGKRQKQQQQVRQGLVH